jgi:hypothetical protein
MLLRYVLWLRRPKQEHPVIRTLKKWLKTKSLERLDSERSKLFAIGLAFKRTEKKQRKEALIVSKEM